MSYNFYMTYKVAVDIRAAKEIGKLDTKIQQRVMDAIRSLASDPKPRGAKKLTGSDGVYRLRVGEYRILYTVDGKKLVVWIVAVRHRREVYR